MLLSLTLTISQDQKPLSITLTTPDAIQRFATWETSSTVYFAHGQVRVSVVFPTSRLMRQVKPKLAEVSEVVLDSCDVVRDSSFTRVGWKGDETEVIPGLLGTGKWRRLKGGTTMGSGCSIDTVPTGYEPNVAMGPVPASRVNRRINAANGRRIKEHDVKQLKFRNRENQKHVWKMLVTDVKKALKFVAAT